SLFTRNDMNLLGVIFKPASVEDVIPDIHDSKKYLLPKINRKILEDKDFDVKKFVGISDNQVRTFITKMHWVLMNEKYVESTREFKTDSLVDNLLRLVKIDDYPLTIANHPLYRLSLFGKPYVSAEPEFVVSNKNVSMVVVEDKHLRNVKARTNFGETQLSAEILACGDENISEKIIEQTVFAMRVISMHVTFYKAVIPEAYWEDLDKGLPQEQSVVIKRWPMINGKQTGLDLANSDEREKVLKSLVKIHNINQVIVGVLNENDCF
ncbi:3246_t:CDS:2, partial [Diversispora eburnea]